MSKQQFFKKIKLHRSYWALASGLVICACLLGIFAASNEALWLQGEENIPIQSQINQTTADTAPDIIMPTTAVPVEPNTATKPESYTVSETAAETTVSVNEATTVADEEPQENTDIQNTVGNTGEALQVGLFSKKLLKPAEAEWTGEYGFGYDETFEDYRFHNGRDMALEMGALVCACAEGTVLQAEENNIWGGIVAVQSKDMIIYYYGILPSSIAVGDEVKAGSIIGTAAAAYDKELAHGSHLHLVITDKGELKDPADYFDK